MPLGTVNKGTRTRPWGEKEDCWRIMCNCQTSVRNKTPCGWTDGNKTFPSPILAKRAMMRHLQLKHPRELKRMAGQLELDFIGVSV